MSADRVAIEAALPAYELGAELGRGAWGVVYAAHHRALGRHAAIKQLPRAFAADPAVRERFVHEARTSGSLDHPHIVSVYDFVMQADGLCLLIMEQCQGSVADTFRTAGLATDQSCAYVLGALAGLSHAHDKGLVHRDIKPSNLLFDEAGTVKLADFGMVRALDQSTRMTASGMVVGTPAYMAPEQVNDEPTTPASDVYSMGVMAYEFLTGELPFENTSSITALIRAHLLDPPRPLAETGPHVPPGIDAVLQKALAKEPTDRHRNAEEMGVHLAEAATRAWGPGWLRTGGFMLSGAPEISAATERDPGAIEHAGTEVVRANRPQSDASIGIADAAHGAGLISTGQDPTEAHGTVPPAFTPGLDAPPPAFAGSQGMAAPGAFQPGQYADQSYPPQAPGGPGGPGGPPTFQHSNPPPSDGGAGGGRSKALIGAGFVGAMILGAGLIFGGLTLVSAITGGDSTSVAAADGMVEIPEGIYTVGSPNPDLAVPETPTSQLNIDSYFIDLNEVTNAEYAAFVAEGADPPLAWNDGVAPTDLDDHPVQGVPFEWAGAYCQALGKRLPNEAEWEVAARGENGAKYAWGDDPRLVSLPEGTYPVGSIPENVSGFGVFDLTGNVWEWVADSYDPDFDSGLQILRGGQAGYLRTNANRLAIPESGSSALQVAGLRCAADEVDAELVAGEFGDFDKPDIAESRLKEVPLPENVLLMENFEDPTTGWVEREATADEPTRFGYHPNEYFHLETTTPNSRVLALAPGDYRGAPNWQVTATVFVEPVLTDRAENYNFGLFARRSDTQELAFVIDPVADTWYVTLAGFPVRSGGFNFDTDVEVELSIVAIGPAYSFLINGTDVGSINNTDLDGGQVGFVLQSGDGEGLAHIHYDSFVIELL